MATVVSCFRDTPVQSMVELFEDAKPMLDGVLANYAHWENNADLADLPA